MTDTRDSIPNSRQRLEQAVDNAREDERKRLIDLVRYSRGTLHGEGLISDEEYAALVQVEGSPQRLEGYDTLKAEAEAHKQAAAILADQLQQAMTDLDAIRDGHRRLAVGIKRALGLTFWPDIKGDFVDGVVSLLQVEVERLRRALVLITHLPLADPNTSSIASVTAQTALDAAGKPETDTRP